LAVDKYQIRSFADREGAENAAKATGAETLNVMFGARQIATFVTAS
jgi:hypothetical protein